MREAEIDKKLEHRDKDLKGYVDMKIRAVKNAISIFIWMNKNPKISALGLFLLIVMVEILLHVIGVDELYRIIRGL
jgi:hypothetical protein